MENATNLHSVESESGVMGMTPEEARAFADAILQEIAPAFQEAEENARQQIAEMKQRIEAKLDHMEKMFSQSAVMIDQEVTRLEIISESGVQPSSHRISNYELAEGLKSATNVSQARQLLVDSSERLIKELNEEHKRWKEERERESKRNAWSMFFGVLTGAAIVTAGRCLYDREQENKELRQAMMW